MGLDLDWLRGETMKRDHKRVESPSSSSSSSSDDDDDARCVVCWS